METIKSTICSGVKIGRHLHVWHVRQFEFGRGFRKGHTTLCRRRSSCSSRVRSPEKFEETLADLRVFISAVRLPGIIEAEQVDNVGQHIVENPAGILPVGKRIEFFAKALELRGQLNLAMTHLLSCQSDFAAFYEPAVTPQLDGAEFEALM